MIRYKLTAEPASEPVTLAEVKQHAKIEIDADDPWLSGAIAVARRAVEQAIGRALITQTWEARLDRWPCESGGEDAWPFYISPTPRRIALKPAGALAVTSMTVDGVTIASTNYQLNGDELAIKSDVADSTAELGGGIAIIYTVGYGASAANVPEPLKLAVKMWVAHLYEARGATSPQGVYHQVIPFGVDTLLLPYMALEI